MGTSGYILKSATSLESPNDRDCRAWDTLDGFPVPRAWFLSLTVCDTPPRSVPTLSAEDKVDRVLQKCRAKPTAHFPTPVTRHYKLALGSLDVSA